MRLEQQQHGQEQRRRGCRCSRQRSNHKALNCFALISILSALVFVQSIESIDLLKILHLQPKRNLFADLNEYLIRNTDSPEADDQFRVIRERLLGGGGGGGDDGKQHTHSEDKALIKFAKKFLALEQIGGDSLCSEETRQLLDALWEALKKTSAINEHPLKYVEKQVPGHERVISVFVDYMKEYKLICKHETHLDWNGKKVHFAHPQLAEEALNQQQQQHLERTMDNMPTQKVSSSSSEPVVYGLDDGYAQLDDFLRAKVKTIDLKENINFAMSLLKSEKKFMEKNPALKVAIEELASLRPLLNEKTSCDKKGSELASEVFESIGRRHLGKNPFNFPRSRRRIGEIVTYFFKERALVCLNKYAQEWEKVKMDKFRGQIQENLYVYKSSISKHGKCEYKPGRVLTDEVQALDCTIQRSFDRNMDELEDLNPIIETFREVFQADQDSSNDDTSTKALTSDRKLIERNLDSVIYDQCRALMKSKKTEPLEKTYKTLLTVELSNNLFKAARHYEKSREIPFRNLINWTTSYGNCLRLLGTDKRKLIDLLYELSHQNVDKLLRETIIKFEDFPQTSRLAVAA